VTEPASTPSSPSAGGEDAPTGGGADSARTGERDAAPTADAAGHPAHATGTHERRQDGASSGASNDRPPGLIAQLQATKDAVLGVLRAHVALGKAEADAIKGEVAYAAAFAGVAIAVLLLLGIFLPIATMLFLGEWLFGSIGWGVLLGAELLVAVAATAVVSGLRLNGPVLAAAVGVFVGVLAFVVFGASWFNRLWTWIGNSSGLAIDGAYRPLVVAIVIVGVLAALVGLLAGARTAGPVGGIGGLVAGFVAGGLIGAFLADDFGWRVGAALGFATFYAVYVGVLAARAASAVDVEKIKVRFWPQQTINTTRETIEWAKARNPLAPKS
jgi:hypothetical protein